MEIKDYKEFGWRQKPQAPSVSIKIEEDFVYNCLYIYIISLICAPINKYQGQSRISENWTPHLNAHWIFISAAPRRDCTKILKPPHFYKLTLALQGRHFISVNGRKAKQRVFLRSKIHTLADLQHHKNLTAKLTGSLFALVSSDQEKKRYIKRLCIASDQEEDKKLCIHLMLLQIIMKISNLEYQIILECLEKGISSNY